MKLGYLYFCQSNRGSKPQQRVHRYAVPDEPHKSTLKLMTLLAREQLPGGRAWRHRPYPAKTVDSKQEISQFFLLKQT